MICRLDASSREQFEGRNRLTNELRESSLPSKDGEALSEIANVEHSNRLYGSCSGQIEPAEWFAAVTMSRHEKTVARLLSGHHIESFLPLYSENRRWKKSRPVLVELPLFPNYVFVHIARSARASILSVPGVSSIVGSSREPWPLRDTEIEALRAAVRSGKARPHPYLNVGERVRIVSGIMAGFEGILTRIKDDMRVVLSLDAIMHSVAVEVSTSDLEAVPGQRSAYAVN